MERKSVSIQLKDFSKHSRTVVFSHAVYGNIDRTGDISMKGMFRSSWDRGDRVDFLFNHDETQVPGRVVRTFEDEQKAYTEAKFGNWQLGNDVMEMVDFGVIKGASFKYEVEKKDYVTKDTRNIRRLLQVKHFESSLLTLEPANPLTAVESLTKSADAINQYKLFVERADKFCRETRASDESIEFIQNEIKQAKTFLSLIDTASTQPITDGEASTDEEKSFANQLHLLKLKF